MDSFDLQNLKLDYNYFADAGFKRAHVDLAYANTKNIDPDALINWMLDNPQSKPRSDSSFIRSSQVRLEPFRKSYSRLQERPTRKSHGLVCEENCTYREHNTERAGILRIVSSTNEKENPLSVINEKALPFSAEEKELLDSILHTYNKDYNKWLHSLVDIVSKLKSEKKKYQNLLRELPRKTNREIIAFSSSVFGSIRLILHQASLNKGEYKELDINSFFYLMNKLYDSQMFTLPQRKSIIKQYENYCELKTLKINKLFGDVILERGLNRNEELQNNEESSGAMPTNDVDPTQFCLTDEWLEDFRKSIEARAQPEVNRTEENGATQNIKEKKFSGQVLKSGLTSREACVRCFEKRRAFLFLPCNHFLVCQDCSILYKKCPTCDKIIHDKVLLFWS